MLVRKGVISKYFLKGLMNISPEIPGNRGGSFG
jgi:hypothetical protein